MCSLTWGVLVCDQQIDTSKHENEHMHINPLTTVQDLQSDRLISKHCRLSISAAYYKTHQTINQLTDWTMIRHIITIVVK